MLIAAVETAVVLGLQRRRLTRFEAVITVLIGVIAASYLVQTVMRKSDDPAIVQRLLIRPDLTLLLIREL